MFLTDVEHTLTETFLNQGYVIRPAADMAALDWIREQFFLLSKEALGIESNVKAEQFLNTIHERVPINELNDFRLKMIRGINSDDKFRLLYYQIAKPYLDVLVGNELAMQLQVNLSIQLPGDRSSLLPLHADTWSGDSPFEVVVWIPLVRCYGTKAMYILSPEASDELSERFSRGQISSSEEMYAEVSDKAEWLEIAYGDVLLFNQALPHGNRVNIEGETRWSMNCRFKGVFTPYGDKKLGEFFEPITLRAASLIGMGYRHPGMVGI